MTQKPLRSEIAGAVKYWELIAADLASKGWTWGYVSEIDAGSGTLFRVDAHRGHGKRYVVRSDQLLTAFLELQEQTRAIS